MKTKYQSPEISVLFVSYEDILTASDSEPYALDIQWSGVDGDVVASSTSIG